MSEWPAHREGERALSDALKARIQEVVALRAERDRLRGALEDQIKSAAHGSGMRPDVIERWIRKNPNGFFAAYASPSAFRALTTETEPQGE